MALFGYEPDWISGLLAAGFSVLPDIDQNRPSYLLGEVEISDGEGPTLAGRLDRVETCNPVNYRGGILQLDYAHAPELGP